jgi:protein tyrosine/serine phosphatase
MRVLRKKSTISIATAIAILALAISSIAQDKQSNLNIKIKNFGCINENYYRGAQPKERDYKDLAALGVKTVIDLRHEGLSEEQQMVEAAGMKYVQMAMKDDKRPNDAQVQEFLKIVNDPVNQPIFVHCIGGRHRTGLMTAIYRIEKDGWDFAKAYDEMKKFDFSYGWGHGDLKEYVADYYSQKEHKATIGASTSIGSSK